MYIFLAVALIITASIWCCLKIASNTDDEMGYDDASL